MSWRIVVIKNRAKLEYKQEYLVYRGEEEHFIHLSEIAMVIIENTAVALTAVILCELVKRKIKVIFCDEKRNPLYELMPYNGHYATTKNISEQIKWKEKTKRIVWTKIISYKILKQKEFLESLGLEEFQLLESYLNALQENDLTNREGHAAKVYFNALYGKTFSRSNADDINSALNYGYTVMLSAFNREIVAQGYLTQIGIGHCNDFNEYNLSCDFIEPYRIIIDKYVFENRERIFNSEYKHDLVDLLNMRVKIDGKEQFLSNSIRIYVSSIFDALKNGNADEIKMYEL